MECLIYMYLLFVSIQTEHGDTFSFINCFQFLLNGNLYYIFEEV